MIRFTYPLGLIGLIGIPLVIIIYLLKNKYQEKVISSTYIWELSEKFLKKKNPINRINGLLSLILQICAILFISIGIAHPILTIKDNAKNYLFVIDSSGSMNIESNDVTRFDRAKNKINEITTSSKNGSLYSLIYASDNSTLILDKTDNKDNVINALNTLSPTNKSFSLDNALNLLQNLYLNDSTYTIYVLTDKDYVDAKNLNIINVSAPNEYNTLINNVDVTYDTNNYLQVNGKVISYGQDKDVNLNLYVDDVDVSFQVVKTYDSSEVNFTFNTTLEDYKKVEVKVTDKDSLSLDSNYILYSNENSSDYSTLIVSDNPTFLRSILKTLGNHKIKVVSTSEYTLQTSYSLYIFDNYSPETLPSDGAVWLFGCSNNIANANFVRQKMVSLSNGGKLNLTNLNNSTYKSLSKNVDGKDIYVSKYQKYSLYGSFTTIFEYDGDPMIFVGSNNFNNKEVVFSFDLHDSNLPLLLDFVALFRNLVSYSIPTMIEENVLALGNTLTINVLPLTENIRVNYPSGYSKFLEIKGSQLELLVDEVGTYNIEATINGNIKSFNIFVTFPFEESKINDLGGTIEIVGEKGKGNFDENFDGLIIAIIIVFAFLAIDWGVYIYEQH